MSSEVKYFDLKYVCGDNHFKTKHCISGGNINLDSLLDSYPIIYSYFVPVFEIWLVLFTHSWI